MSKFRFVLALLAAIPFITGAGDLVLGAHSLNLAGSALDAGAVSNASLDSQIRFFSVIWIGYGVLLLLVRSDVERYVALFRVVMSFIVLSGIGRIVSMVQLGLPSPVLVGATAVEVVLFPAVMLWHARLVRSG